VSTRLKLKIGLLVFLLIFAGFLLLPTFVPNLPPWFKKYVYRGELKLGLDLKGGVHLILQPDIKKALDTQFQQYLQNLKLDLSRAEVNFELSVNGTKAVFKFFSKKDADTFKKLVKNNYPDIKIISEKVREGVFTFKVELSPERVSYIKKHILNQVLEVIRNRIDQFGVAEAVVTTEGSDKVVVQLPGLKNPKRAIKVIGQTAQLEFHLVDEEAMKNIGLIKAVMNSLIKQGKIKENAPLKEWRKLLKPYIPPGDALYFMIKKDPKTGKTILEPYILKKQAVLTGSYLRNAQVRIDPRTNEPYVWLEFDSRGAKIFAHITEENVGKRLAIVLDNVVKSAPVIREKISGGEAQITGNFTMQEASDLALVLRAGALPAPVKIVQDITIGPSLGKDSIRKGITAGLIGAAAVIVFTCIYYQISGVIAVIALILNIYFLLALLSAFQATLTLPGIAGIILSIGMGVDSNVLIFERIREEMRLGRTGYSAIFQGYSRAFWTIFDAHITVLITSLILFIFGTGPIRGFAVTLSISIIVNLFTSIFVTKIFYEYMYEKGKDFKVKFLELIRNPNFDFMKYKKVCAVISGILCILGIIGSIQAFRGKANLGIDFTGGTLLYLKTSVPPKLDQIRKALADAGVKDFTLQDVKGENMILLKIKSSKATVSKNVAKIMKILNSHFPQYHFKILAKEQIGAVISKELRNKAILAIIGALIGIILYLSFRFNFNFGVAAGIATFHDVLVTVGIFYVLGKEINLLFITALLTLAGYSLTDTVVIFDRIRENIIKKRFKEFDPLINASVNEMLARTLITSLTTLFGSVSLLLFGGIVIRDFALALTIGFIVGTYSSIFIASPILKILHKGKIPVLTGKEHLF